MIQQLYPQYSRGFGETRRNLPILTARVHPAAGMIVSEYYTRSTRPYSGLEDFPGMYEGFRKCADRDNRSIYDFVLGIQQHGDEVFPVRIGYLPSQKLVYIRWR